MIENIEQALKGIFSHKMRSFLTMLGVIIGIAAIIAIVSIVEGTSQKLEKNLVGSGNNVTTVAPSNDGTYPYEMESGLPKGLSPVTPEAMDNVLAIDGVRNASAYNERDIYEMSWRDNNSHFSAKMYGIDSSFLDTMDYSIASGRDFTAEEYDSHTKIGLVDENMSRALFKGENPIGQVMMVRDEPIKIIGVVKDNNAVEKEYESIDDYYRRVDYESYIPNLYVPKGIWPIIFQYDEPESVAVAAKDTKNMASTGKEAADILNSANNGEEVTYRALKAGETDDSLNTLTNSITIMLISVASLSLLVGGIGVMNIMLVSVTERTGEIGLKKALGAKKRNILAQFLTESAVLTGVGGILGVIAGIGLAKVISVVLTLEFAISIPWIIVAVLFSLGIGVVFGVMPSSKAAKLNPIDALRRE